MAAGSTAMTWSYSRPLTRVAGITVTRAPVAGPSGVTVCTPASVSADRSPSTASSAAITAIDPSNASAVRTSATVAAVRSRTVRTSRVPSLRSDSAGGTSTASAGSSRLAKESTAAGTRNPMVNGTTVASGLPRWRRLSRQSLAAHGAVACARSPRSVSEPCSLRRAMTRHCIGESPGPRPPRHGRSRSAVRAVRPPRRSAPRRRPSSGSPSPSVPTRCRWRARSRCRAGEQELLVGREQTVSGLGEPVRIGVQRVQQAVRRECRPDGVQESGDRLRPAHPAQPRVAR